jgi:hypothetical protein
MDCSQADRRSNSVHALSGSACSLIIDKETVSFAVVSVFNKYFFQFSPKPDLGADYMESFQPGLSFSPVKRAEIASRLHERFEPGLSLVRAIFIVNPG